LKRRDLLIGSMAAASVAAYGTAQDTVLMSKLDRVGAMSGNFDGLLKEVRDWKQPATPGELDIMDFPSMLANRYHIHNVEVQQIHFLSMESAYFDKFHARLQKANSRMVNMPLELDDSGYKGVISPCSPDPQLRAHAIDLTKQWIDRSAMIECPSIMPNQGAMLEGDLTPAIDALKQLADYGAAKGVSIILEPRGKTPVDTLLKVIKEAGIYANPDIGNFGNEEKTERGLRLMYPLAKTVSHVKWNPERFNFATAIGISKEMGFRGVYSMETGGPEPYAMQQQLLDYLLPLL
jgi:xylose isomerase-like TIM barrel protein